MLSEEQGIALKKIRKWLKNTQAFHTTSKNIFRLFGNAGTGKSTLAKELTNETKLRTAFCAYTGKAAMVLRKKGIKATTIHSLIYEPNQDPATGEVKFGLRPVLNNVDLIIIDECSMVNEPLLADLLSFGIPLLAMGDPDQLPPVEGHCTLIEGEPDFRLTKIHRQALDSPILYLANRILNDLPLKKGRYNDTRVLTFDRFYAHQERYLADLTDQVLCGKNDTRTFTNQTIREFLGFRDCPLPERKEKLVCLKNAGGSSPLLNGSLWEVVRTLKAPYIHQVFYETEDKRTKARHRRPSMYPNDHPLYPGKQVTVEAMQFKVESLDLHTLAPLTINVPLAFFQGKDHLLDWRQKQPPDIISMTYGYCLTCHKSQGSEWENVTVIDESSAFREQRKKWLYTAVTRASERLFLVQT